MLCALATDYEGSERYYRELQAFAHRCGRQDAAGKQARSRLAWLDISLPQRGVNGLTETFPAVFRLMCSHELALPSFSVTSTLPSIMNGGKDFSEWSKRDDLLYKTLRARFASSGLTRFLPNMDAMLCRVALHTGDLDAAGRWYREKAPRDPMHLNVMLRYQYLTQAMTELAFGDASAALMTLAPLEPYCVSCAPLRCTERRMSAGGQSCAPRWIRRRNTALSGP